jgi:hypothetical protein
MQINFLAVLVAGILGFIIGGVWYTIFGNMIYKMSKKTTKNHSSKTYVLGFLFSIVTAFALAIIMNYINDFTILGGLKISLLIWAGFVIPETIGGVIWEEEPFSGYVLGALLDLISIVAMGLIIAVLH